MNDQKPDTGSRFSFVLSLVIFVLLSVFIVKFVVRVFTPSKTQPPAYSSSVSSAAPTPEPTPTATPEPTPHPEQADADRVGYPLDQYLNMKQTMLDCGFDETTIRLVKAIGTNEAYCNWGKSVVKIRFDADYKVCGISCR